MDITALFYNDDEMTSLEVAHLNCTVGHNGRPLLTKEFRQGKTIFAVVKGHVSCLAQKTEDFTSVSVTPDDVTVLFYNTEEADCINVSINVAHLHIPQGPERESGIRRFMGGKTVIAVLGGHVTVVNTLGERFQEGTATLAAHTMTQCA